MAKNELPPTVNITWHLTNDGMEPAAAPWGFIVRNPLGLQVPPNSSVQVNLHVSTNHPMMAFPSRGHMDDVTVAPIVHAGQPIVVLIQNKSSHAPMTIETKEALVNLHPIVHDHGRTLTSVG